MEGAGGSWTDRRRGPGPGDPGIDEDGDPRRVAGGGDDRVGGSQGRRRGPGGRSDRGGGVVAMLRLERGDGPSAGVARLVLDRPDQRNAVSTALLEELAAALG